MNPRNFGLAGLALASALLIAAFSLPFLRADLDIEFPGWVEKGLDAYDAAAAGLDWVQQTAREALGIKGGGEPTPPRPARERLEAWLVEKGGIPVGEQYLPGIIGALLDGGDVLLGLAILLFSIVFPAVKIVLGGAALLRHDRLTPRERYDWFHRLALVSKWSMADVFIAAMVVVFFKAEGFHYRFTTGAGLYCFAASAILSGLIVSRAVAWLGPDRDAAQLALFALEKQIAGLDGDANPAAVREAMNEQAAALRATLLLEG